MSGRGKGKTAKKAVSRSAKAGLQFPVGRVARYLKQGKCVPPALRSASALRLSLFRWIAQTLPASQVRHPRRRGRARLPGRRAGVPLRRGAGAGWQRVARQQEDAVRWGIAQPSRLLCADWTPCRAASSRATSSSPSATTRSCPRRVPTPRLARPLCSLMLTPFSLSSCWARSPSPPVACCPTSTACCCPRRARRPSRDAAPRSVARRSRNN